MKEIKIEVYGRVQGINFRKNVKSFAEKNDIRGYVLNRDDGSVFVVGQGDKDRLDRLVEWIKTSPGLSDVSKVDFIFEDPSETFIDFKVERVGNIFSDKARGFMKLYNQVMVKEKEREFGQIPRHIALIPDGNRRWAKSKGLEASLGHKTSGSYDRLRKLFKEAQRLGVQYFSIWAFSTENWKRDPKEIKVIFDIVLADVKRFRDDAQKEGLRFVHIGRKDRIPKELADELAALEKETLNNERFTIILAIDYGGRDEIVRATNDLLKKRVRNVDEESFGKQLDTVLIPDPDLVIRTAGEKRLSGFMLYQAAYAELYFTEVLFPDFDEEELRNAIDYYGQRKRTFGGD